MIVANCVTAKIHGPCQALPEGKIDLSPLNDLTNTSILGDKHQDLYLPAHDELQPAAAYVPHLFGADN